MSCAEIGAEIEANNHKIQGLSGEEGGKVGQNVAAGVAGLFIWPIWFAMDFQDAAGKEGRALQDRNAYLGTVSAERCQDNPTPVADVKEVGAIDKPDVAE